MGFEWDEAKASSNRIKHGIDFADAVGVFEDPYALTMVDPDEEEERYITLGLDFLGRVLVVVYTWRDEATIRMISARRATPQEQLACFEGRS